MSSLFCYCSLETASAAAFKETSSETWSLESSPLIENDVKKTDCARKRGTRGHRFVLLYFSFKKCLNDLNPQMRTQSFENLRQNWNLIQWPVSHDDNIWFVTLYGHQGNGLTNGKWDLKLFSGFKKLPRVFLIAKISIGNRTLTECSTIKYERKSWNCSRCQRFHREWRRCLKQVMLVRISCINKCLHVSYLT